jgi:adenylosuccinate synthase
MSVSIVVGAQWGDEAKGKMVDLLCESADIVARFNGGDNAGHTVINQFGTFKLRLTPNGIANPKTTCIIGPGVVVNLATLLSEINYIRQAGLELRGRLWVSPRCNLVMPYHLLVEAIYETAKGASATGTTRRGMGPTYADKVSYNGIRLYDLADADILRQKVQTQLTVKNHLFQCFDQPALDVETIVQEKLAQYAGVQPYVKEPFGLLQDALRAGKNIVLEAAQGALLDNDWGTYPFVTASTTISGGAGAGLGIAPRWVDRVIGVAKAYTTRVGAGPMPSELLDATGDAIRSAGGEFGTVTGRPRRCGWIDTEILRFTAQLNGFTDLALTKLDVLDALPVVQLCVGYRHPESGDAVRHYWEGDARWLSEVEPMYIEMEGWQQPTKDVRQFEKLPRQAQAYVRKVEELVETPVKFVSVGPQREAIIFVK